ncbi:nucleotidyltransferase family protein [Flavitalea sp.]|nr:nucleotidyltransferase family protein [Flavitalea sp.]
MQEFVIVILAAGESSRLGEPKQLLIYEGITFLERSIQLASALAGDKVCVVLGANATTILKKVPQAARLSIINDKWKDGMGTSIALGLKTALNLYPVIKSAIFMTVDQLFVTSEHLKALVSLHEQSGKPIVASSYQDAAGIPALFDQTFFKDLLNLETDKGARDIIRSHDHQVAKLALPGGEVDIDTPEQYALLQNRRN